MSTRTQLPQWQALIQHATRQRGQVIGELFRADSQRFDKFSRRMGDCLYDFSKNNLTVETIDLLLELASAVGISQWREDLWAGKPINSTEARAVLHMALRDRTDRAFWVEGQDISGLVKAQLARVQVFTEQVRSHAWLGFTGAPITDIVSIGVGGSNLGPQMVCEALSAYADKPLRVHFVSNVDGQQLNQTLANLKPEQTLFIVCSKTFTTRETMINAASARRWLVDAAPDQSAVAQHFVAVTSAADKALQMGISRDSIFDMWDWVGGRFSLWSAIGLPIALFVGFEQFEQLLAGAYEMDQHFLQAPHSENIPVLMALIGLWNNTFLGSTSQAILPYDQALKYLPAYLQQAEMESNGKSVTRAGEGISYNTGAILWGQLGIDGQHAFYQLLHQGVHTVPADFIGSVEPLHALEAHHSNLLANMFAQSQALMEGIDAKSVRADLTAQGKSTHDVDALIAHKVHPGNRPSNTVLLKKITPHSLGGLIALYEHKIFVQGIVWDICSYDQWGVELGKQLAARLEHQLAGVEPPATQDSSTTGLIQYYLQTS